MHFGENQLSRNLIGLSPLAPSHPPGFQPRWVRSSTRSYPRFNLLRARSSRFGSRTRDFKRLLRLAFATHTPHGLCSPHATDSQTHFSIGTPSPHKGAPTVRRRMVSETVSLPSRGTFHLSLTVLVRYRSDRNIQAYPTVWADSHGVPRDPCYLGDAIGRPCAFRYGALTLCGPVFNPVPLTHGFLQLPAGPSEPAHAIPQHPARNPRRVSHAQGLAIIRFRSPLLTEYPFLQVLRCFTSLRTPRTRRYRPMTAGGFPHSEILGSKPCWRLPEAYRSLKRPSSVLSAKASTIRPCRQHAPHGAHGRKDPS